MTTIDPPVRTSSLDVRVLARRRGGTRESVDRVSVEEPLEIRVQTQGRTHRVACTMRTPGCDVELAAGFVLNEAIVTGREQILRIDADDNVATVEVDGEVGTFDGLERLHRRDYRRLPPGAAIGPEVLAGLTNVMHAKQSISATLTGLSAAALFALDGSLLAMREDVSVHSAVDKLSGWLALTGACDPARTAIAISARCDYEIVQKALATGIPIVASPSTPSSLAIALAREFGLTLAGSVRNGGWNLYAGYDRVSPLSP